MLYCINRVKKEKQAGQRTAGKKAPDDIAYISQHRLKAKVIEFYEHTYTAKLLKPVDLLIKRLLNITNWKRVQKTVKKGDILILQHPYEGLRGVAENIRKCRGKGVAVIMLIHDLLSLRQNIEYKHSNKENAFMSTEEIEILKLCDGVICHNEKMKQYLTNAGIAENKLQCLGIFDYIISQDQLIERTNDGSVSVAGNLDPAKGGYIYQLIAKQTHCFRLNLYGPNFKVENVPEHVSYKGQLAPELLPSKIEGAFGLVWDGESAQTCAGVPGEYLKINNPHKCSLYIVSGLPVIIWDQAALAPFVTKNGIGITVSSLDEVADKLSAVSDTDYESMRTNVLKMRQKLIKGDYFVNAVNHTTAAMKAKRQI